MKITLFTSNKIRHNYLINLLSNVSDQLFVVQECGTIFSGIVPGHYPASPIMKEYFKNVNDAQFKLFGKSYVNKLKGNISILPIVFGDLNQCSMDFLSDFLKSDLYIVFGSSYIKGDLIDFLIKNKAINIHMGVSPFYRGADCNFWALYDNNPHLVGATIHMLSKGIDSGPILFHAMSNIKKNPFEYTMSTVKSAFHSLLEKIKNKSIYEISSIEQNNNNEIRYSKGSDFNEKIVKSYFEKKINLSDKKFNLSLLKDPFFLKD